MNIILPAIIWAIFQETAKIYMGIEKKKNSFSKEILPFYLLSHSLSDLIWWDLKMISL